MRTQTFTPAALACLAPAALVSSAFVSGNACGSHEVSVRLPPNWDPAIKTSNTSSECQPPTSSWVPPPINFITGSWFVSNATTSSFLSYSNLQWDLYPSIATCRETNPAYCAPGTAAGALDEITSWTPTDNKTSRFGAVGPDGRPLASVRAFNNPRRVDFPKLNSDWDGVFDNVIIEGPGKGWNQTWSIICWGVDDDDFPFMWVHESPGYMGTGGQIPIGIDVMSMNPEGPALSTFEKVAEAVDNLGSEMLSGLVKKLGPTRRDHELEVGPAVCDSKCLSNVPIGEQ